MQQVITLQEEDLKKALTQYMLAMGVQLNEGAAIAFRNGRKGNGTSCVITADTSPAPIKPAAAPAPVEPAPVAEQPVQEPVVEEAPVAEPTPAPVVSSDTLADDHDLNDL